MARANDGTKYETFEVTAEEFRLSHPDTWMYQWMDDEGATAEGLAGYYYWFCQPGCLPEGDASPCGPFDGHQEANKAATTALFGDTDRYEVIVSNIGTVGTMNDRREASNLYNEYVRKSKSKRGGGRVYGEDVTIMDDGEPIREFEGRLAD